MADVPDLAQPLPSYADEVAAIKRMLKDNRSLGLILVDASNLSRIERLHGKKLYRETLLRVGQIMQEFQGAVIRRDDMLTVDRNGGDQFLLFLNKKREDKYYCSTGLESVSDRIGKEINSRVYEEMFHLLKGKPNLTVGHSIVIFNPMIEEENLIHRLLNDARSN
jgi:GGDEF domain-containing protein